MKKKTAALLAALMLLASALACAEGAPTAWRTFDDVIAGYREALATLQDEARVEALGVDTDLIRYATAENTGYALTDVNGDGESELTILTDGGFETPVIAAMYVMQDGAPAAVFESIVRGRYFLGADGSILFEGSDGAAYTIDYAYGLADNAPVILSGVYSEEDESGQTVWYDANGAQAYSGAGVRTDEAQALAYIDAMTPAPLPEGYTAFSEIQ